MRERTKGFLSGLLAAALLVGFVGTAAATVGKVTKEVDYNDIGVTLNGKDVALVNTKGEIVEPFSIDGTIYLPLRPVANALGLDVNWDGATTTAVLTTPEASKAVYITRTGSKYHYDSKCNGGTYWEVPFSTATGMGLTPCDKCVH